jgi:diguanylate cyclase (GGDEF)-like protein
MASSIFQGMTPQEQRLFLQEQFDANLWAVRGVLVAGVLFFFVRGFLDYANGITTFEAFQVEMVLRTAVLLGCAVLWPVLQPRRSRHARAWAMIAHVLILSTGICSVTLLNLAARQEFTLISLIMIYLVIPALWVRKGVIMATLGLAFLPPLAIIQIGHMSRQATHAYLFYMFLASLIGMVIRHGWLAGAAVGFRMRQHLIHQALRDPLTGVLNRSGWESSVVATFQGGSPSQPTSLLFFDLDNFKLVNDAHGHPVGDSLIRATCERIQRHLRATDLLARFGGEEFVVLLPNTHLDQAAKVAQRIRQSVAQEDQPVPSTISVGAAEMVPGENMTGLIERADLALLRAKQSGKNQVCLAGV